MDLRNFFATSLPHSYPLGFPKHHPKSVSVVLPPHCPHYRKQAQLVCLVDVRLLVLYCTGVNRSNSGETTVKDIPVLLVLQTPQAF